VNDHDRPAVGGAGRAVQVAELQSGRTITVADGSG
jgi:hypothetical protein